MVSEIASFVMKALLSLVVWVFVLSVEIEDKMLFEHAHGFLVDNEIVTALKGQMNEIWEEVSQTAKKGIDNAPSSQKEVL